jgi:flavin-dependent dehydrogenase
MTGRDLIIGGGLAGAGLAVHLAKAGRDVVILERERGPHDKVCGEFLSFEATASLRRLGVDPVALGAVPISRVAVCVGIRRVETVLPFPALSLGRRVLDEALLVHAQTASAEVKRGVRVTGLEQTAAGWIAHTAQGPVTGRQAFLATGKHDLRSWKRPAGRQSDLIGFKVYLRLRPESRAQLEGAVELHLFPGGYAGLEPIEDGKINLCLLVRRREFVALGQNWQALVEHVRRHCPRLDDSLDWTGENDQVLAVSAIPYGFVARSTGGPWRLGDQAAVIPSFAGEGMSIALHSAELAADFVLAGLKADAFQQRLVRNVSGRIRAATLLSQVLVQPLAQPLIGIGLALIPQITDVVSRWTRLPKRVHTARRFA